MEHESLLYPLRLRSVLRTAADPRRFESSFRGREHDPNKFFGLMFGDEITELMESSRGDAFLHNNYQAFKQAAIKNPASK